MYVIGLVGPFGSGCSYVAEKISDTYGYKVFSLSDVLRDEFKAKYPNKRKVDRQDLQDFGDTIRKENGCDYLAKIICEKINADKTKNYVVDSIRNPEEINLLRKSFAQKALFTCSTSSVAHIVPSIAFNTPIFCSIIVSP